MKTETKIMTAQEILQENSIVHDSFRKRMNNDSVIQVFRPWDADKVRSFFHHIFDEQRDNDDEDKMPVITIANGELIDGRQMYYQLGAYGYNRFTYNNQYFNQLDPYHTMRFLNFKIKVTVIETGIDAPAMFNKLNSIGD